jgi:alpha-D-ribose 1-methylphosphonate 5-triphosphate synthase subunit PhnI
MTLSVVRADRVASTRTGVLNPTKTATMAMQARISVKVKPRLDLFTVFLHVLLDG